MADARVAVVPVRDGALSAGGDECAVELGGRVVLIGSGVPAAAGHLVATTRDLHEVSVAEVGPFAPGRWAAALAPLLADVEVIGCPASADGRDLAARLAAVLDRPLFAGAVEVGETEVTVASDGARTLTTYQLDEPAVVTLLPGVIEVDGSSDIGAAAIATLDLSSTVAALEDRIPEASVLSVDPPDAATMDLADADRIVGGGAGLMVPGADGAAHDARFALLAAVGERLGASMGATRVVTDAGPVHHDRQIGTTGVVVDPSLYLAFGISGAIQHTAGLGHPEHTISVNTDPYCPMMELADVAITADAVATLDRLAELLGVGVEPGTGP